MQDREYLMLNWIVRFSLVICHWSLIIGKNLTNV